MNVWIKDIQSGGLVGTRDGIYCDEVIYKENYIVLKSYYGDTTIDKILPNNPDWMYIIEDDNVELEEEQ